MKDRFRTRQTERVMAQFTTVMRREKDWHLWAWFWRDLGRTLGTRRRLLDSRRRREVQAEDRWLRAMMAGDDGGQVCLTCPVAHSTAHLAQ